MRSRLKSAFEKAVWWTGVVSLGLAVGLSIQIARAWVSPTQAPPDGNVGAPINTGAIGQFKNGVMRALGLQTPNLRVEVPEGQSAMGRYLKGVTAEGDVAFAAGNPGGEGGIQCPNGNVCINPVDGRICATNNGMWHCYTPVCRNNVHDGSPLIEVVDDPTKASSASFCNNGGYTINDTWGAIRW